MQIHKCKVEKCSLCSHLKGEGGIEVTKAGTLSTGDGVIIFRMLTLRHMLKIEAHGIKFKSRTSVHKQIKSEFGLKGNREEVIAQFDALLKTHGFQVGAEKTQDVSKVKIEQLTENYSNRAEAQLASKFVNLDVAVDEEGLPN